MAACWEVVENPRSTCSNHEYAIPPSQARLGLRSGRDFPPRIYFLQPRHGNFHERAPPTAPSGGFATEEGSKREKHP